MDFKQEYTVKELAQLLSTNEETVRRWIRTGKLEADLGYGKQGHRISAAQLDDFLKRTPKYATVFGAAVGLAVSPLLAPAATALGIASVAGATLGSALPGGLFGLALRAHGESASNHVHEISDRTDSPFESKPSSSDSKSVSVKHTDNKDIIRLRDQIEETKSRIYVCQMLMKTYETQIERCTALHKEELIGEIKENMSELSQKIESLTDLLKTYEKQLDIFVRLEG